MTLLAPPLLRLASFLHHSGTPHAHLALRFLRLDSFLRHTVIGCFNGADTAAAEYWLSP